MKKNLAFLVSILTIILLFSSISIAASKFKDVNNTKYDSAVEKLTGLGVIDGFEDGTYRPSNPVTRAQLCKLIVESLKLKKKTEVALTKFSDVAQENWAYSYIKIAVDNEIIVGYPDGTFKPNKEVTYAESTTMILRGMGQESKMKDKTWPTGYMNEASTLGLLKDVEYEAVENSATRGEVAIALNNLIRKKEDEQKAAELAKKEAEEKAIEDAKKNAWDFGVVNSIPSSSKSEYYLKLKSDNTKYVVGAIDGVKKLSDSALEKLEGTVIGYTENKDGEMEVHVSYVAKDLDSALIVSKVNNKILTYKSNGTLDTASDATKKKYATYTFITITCSYDEDEEDAEISFTKVAKNGIGIEKVTIAKADRLMIDDTNKIFAIVKGFNLNDKIKKGVVTESSDDNDDDTDTSNYKYGYVSKVSKTTVTIDGKKYDIGSKSKDFDEETMVAFELDSDKAAVLKKAYGYTSLDDNCKIVSSVTSKTKVKYDGSSTEYDYSTKTNINKYTDYAIYVVDVIDDDDVVALTDAEEYDDIDDVTFKVGDRVLIDNSNDMFLIFRGLKSSDSYKKGKYVDPSSVKYTVSYAWKKSKLSGFSLPKSTTVAKGGKYTVPSLTMSGYKITTDKTGTITVNSNVEILVSWEAVAQYTVNYVWKNGTALSGVTLPSSTKVNSGSSFKVATFTKSGYDITTDKTGTITITANTTITVSYSVAKPKYSITYVWADGTGLSGVSLPANTTVEQGSTYQVLVPKHDGYTFTATPTGKITPTANTTIKISYKKVESEEEKAIHEAEARVEAAQKAVDDLKTEISSLKSDLSKKKTDLSNAKAQIKEYEEDNESIDNRLEELVDLIDTYKAKDEKAKEALDEATDENREELQAEYDEIHDKYTGYVSEQARKNQDKKSNNTAITNFNKTVSSLETEISNLESKIEGKEDELATANEELVAAQKALIDLKK